MKKTNEVIIYTSALCGFCYKAKSLLKKKNIFFHEINVDLDYNKKEEMITKSNGRKICSTNIFWRLSCWRM